MDQAGSPTKGGQNQGKRRSALPYYVAKIQENGKLEHRDERKQFIIQVGSEVRFQLDCGIKISRGAKLLINKPKKLNDGSVEYTMTQPILNEEPLDHKSFEGSALDTQYLEQVDPYPTPSQYQLEFRVLFEYSGSFFVQLAYQDEVDPEVERYTEAQYINVEPVMSAGGRGIRGKELSLMTVMSRCLGKMSRWPQVLNNIQELGYNAVHFTPIQQYGESFSHYSLAGQTTIDDYYFESPASLTPVQRIAKLGAVLQDQRDKGMLSIVDIVLNHTANDSKWIVDHPEATYNTDDCPHLYSSWLFDKMIQDFSIEYADRKIKECPAAPYIRNAAELDACMNALGKRVIEQIKVHEFFLCDVRKVMRDSFIPNIQELNQAELEKYKKIFEKKGWFQRDHFELVRDKFTEGMGSGPTRQNVTLKMPDAAMFFMLSNNRNREAATKEVEKLLYSLNDDWKRRAGEFMGDAWGAIRGNISYFKIEQGQSHITRVNRLLEPYFSELNNAKRSKVAHNGWIGGWDCEKDFGMEGWNYLRRHVNIWADNIKLRYGSCPADSPNLWKHMTQYCQDMASVADGFRLDNTHSTPIHVCQYLLQAARSKNPNLFVMAELFTDSARLDAQFCKKLNLNAMVRELQNRYDAGSCADYFHQLTCTERPVGVIDDTQQDLQGRLFRVLKSRKPEDMLYDCTHDNPSVLEKFQTGRLALPLIGLSSLGDCSIATTWGYDLLVKDQIHCVSEKRLYPIFDQSGFVTADPNDVAEQALIEAGKNRKNAGPGPTSFEYEFSIDVVASSVAVAGEFNGWKPTINMQKIGGSWKARATLPVPADGGRLQYKYVLNGSEWVLNEAAPKASDPRGKINNAVPIPGRSAAEGMVASGGGQGAPAQKTLEDIRFARMCLNRVHTDCTRRNAEIYMHKQAEDVVVVTRALEADLFSDFDSYVSISRFCYYNKGGDYNYATSVELPGFMSEVIFAGYLEIPDSVYNDPRLGDKQHLYGPRGCKFQSFNHLDGKFCHRERLNDHQEKLNFFFMPPSFTCVIKVKSRSFVKEAVAQVNGIQLDPRLDKIFTGAPQGALNHVLFRCGEEERDLSAGTRGGYGLDSCGEFPYAGLTSVVHLLRELKLSKDMGAELFSNIRAGDWLVDYTVNRIRDYQKQEPTIGLQKLTELLSDQIAAAKSLPAHLKPKYVARVIEAVYSQAVKEVMCRRILDDFFADSEDIFVQKLSLAIYQMYGRVQSVYFKDHKESMCAGLPHFSTGYMRCWGRDTFIALRGLMIVTGLEDESRDVILFFAKVMRHGLLPNLHDGGGNTRFNSRDAPWFFLQAIKDYVLISEEGEAFLDQKFELHFRDDDQGQHMKKTKGRTLTILDQIIEICQRHAQGMEFREWNAGPKIDAHMKDEGYNVKIHCDIEKTGFCFGGNKDNCGTWMDKMGSSEYTKNKGVPATPRDGAPIELVAMQYSIVSWLASLAKAGKIKQSSIKIQKNGREMEITFAKWADQMKANFERCFWVPTERQEDSQYDVNTKIVNRRGIYKDVYGSSQSFTDYQLRCNLCIAMSYAPELFDRKHAQICLKNVANILMERGCMGIKTLDPKDRQYNGDYVNSDATHGWNYHQGPEWVWPVGFFLKAQLIFNDYTNQEEARYDTMKWLVPHKEYIQKDKWEGLPELTNSHGQYCPDSCETQAWSISTIIDAMRDLHYYGDEEAAGQRN